MSCQTDMTWVSWSFYYHVISSLPPQKPPGLLGFISIWRCAKTKSTVHGGYNIINMHSRFLKVAIGTTINFETNHSSSHQSDAFSIGVRQIKQRRGQPGHWQRRPSWDPKQPNSKNARSWMISSAQLKKMDVACQEVFIRSTNMLCEQIVHCSLHCMITRNPPITKHTLQTNTDMSMCVTIWAYMSMHMVNWFSWRRLQSSDDDWMRIVLVTEKSEKSQQLSKSCESFASQWQT